MKYVIAIVDDHKIFREGFKLVLKSIGLVKQVHEASGGKELLEILSKEKVDLVFMDINMPGIDGVEATQKALQLYPGIKIIAISAYDSTDYVNKMIHAGVEGYLLKDADYEEVEEAIKNVMNDKNYFSQKILINITKSSISKRDDNRKKSDLPHLTDRETQVVKMLCKGEGKREIAAKLFISERTVEKHKENLLMKTGVNNSVNLVIYALKHKIAEL